MLGIFFFVDLRTLTVKNDLFGPRFFQKNALSSLASTIVYFIKIFRCSPSSLKKNDADECLVFLHNFARTCYQ